MELFLLRHGHAHAMAPTDQERALSDAGRADVRANMSKIKTDLAKLQAVWVSPYRRAQETWEEARVFLPNAPVAITNQEITPDGSPLSIIASIAEAGVESLLIVTHQPLVGYLVDQLTGSVNLSGFMDTSDVIALDVSDPLIGTGVIRWHSKVKC